MINFTSQSCARLSILLVVLLILVCGVFAWGYFETRAELDAAQMTIKENQFRSDVAEFGRLFVDKVLKADQEVDFETRLKLENQVRDLKDEKILNQWNQFIASQSEADAQASVKDLLSTIMSKVCTEK